MAGGAADVPEPTTGPTLLSVSSSETQKCVLAPFELSQFLAALDLKLKSDIAEQQEEQGDKGEVSGLNPAG